MLRDNHLGDWGTQFGKQLYAIKHLGEGEEKNIENIEGSLNPVEELVKLYVAFHKLAEDKPEIEDDAREWFNKLENGDGEARKLWQMCVNWSWKEFDRIYRKLGVSFSEEFDEEKGLGEAFFEDKMDVVLEQLQDKNLLEEGNNGVKMIFLMKKQIYHLPHYKKDGASLYSTRDLALIIIAYNSTNGLNY